MPGARLWKAYRLCSDVLYIQAMETSDFRLRTLVNGWNQVTRGVAQSGEVTAEATGDPEDKG
jgi:hypothetical protein